MSIETRAPHDLAKAIASKDLALTRDFGLEIINDPTLLEQIPDGVMLVLLPDDDPEYAAFCIKRGLADLERGFDVFFRHYPTKRTLPRDDDADSANGE